MKSRAIHDTLVHHYALLSDKIPLLLNRQKLSSERLELGLGRVGLLQALHSLGLVALLERPDSLCSCCFAFVTSMDTEVFRVSKALFLL